MKLGGYSNKSIKNIKNVEVKYFDVYVFPEVENLLCLGKIKDIDKFIIELKKNNIKVSYAILPVEA